MEDIFFKHSNIFYNILCFVITENEKLFDRSDSELYWTTVYHMIAVLHHGYIGILAFGIDVTPSSQEHLDNLYRYRIGFLTGWNFIFQTIFLAMSFTYNMLEWMDKHKSRIARRLKYSTDILFSGLVVPLTMFISTFFWIIYWIDRELVFPQIYDQLLPWWMNHCVHTNILIVIALETLLQSRRYPANRKVELWLTGIAAIVYAIVYYSIYFFAHRWLYGVFGIMTWWQVCLFQILIFIYTFVAYFIQFPINGIFHREASEINDEKTRYPNTEANTASKASIPDDSNSKSGSKYQMESSIL